MKMNNALVFLNRALIVVTAVLILKTIATAAEPETERKVRILYMDEKTVKTVRVNENGTILNFPVRPTKVILGKKKAFDVEYVENDVALSPLAADSETNLFVYLLGRRYAFNLKVTKKSGDEIVIIRDAFDYKDEGEQK